MARSTTCLLSRGSYNSLQVCSAPISGPSSLAIVLDSPGFALRQVAVYRTQRMLRDGNSGTASGCSGIAPAGQLAVVAFQEGLPKGSARMGCA
jgi:hypothetical protein